MAEVSVSIMAHPVRRQSVNDLQRSLDRRAKVVYDKVRTPSSDPRQRWEVARRAWESIDTRKQWGLVLQDDIQVSQDFTAGVEKALDEFDGQGLISFYTGTGRPDQAHVRRALQRATTRQESWMSVLSLNWGPAICIPTNEIPEMLDWCSNERNFDRMRNLNLDYRIGVYFRDIRKWRAWYTVPSLVEHKDLPSLVGHDFGPKRVAYDFHQGSALDIDWTRHGQLRTTT